MVVGAVRPACAFLADATAWTGGWGLAGADQSGPPPMNTRFLETFVWLNRLKSFSGTADKLNSTQPSISGRIVALEELLGVALYQRNLKGFELTAAGRRILGHCEQIVELAQQLKAIAAGKEAPNRPIRIGMSDAISLSWMPDLADALSGSYPTNSFEFITGDSPSLARSLRGDELDVALVASTVDGPQMVNEPLCQYRVTWMANPRKFDVRRPISIDLLRDLPIIMPPPATPGHQWQADYLNRHAKPGTALAKSNVFLSCGLSPATAIDMVRRGLGVMPLPVLLARPWIERGEIAVLPVEEPFPPWMMSAAYKAPATFPLISHVVAVARSVAADYARQQGGEDIWQ